MPRDEFPAWDPATAGVSTEKSTRRKIKTAKVGRGPREELRVRVVQVPLFEPLLDIIASMEVPQDQEAALQSTLVCRVERARRRTCTRPHFVPIRRLWLLDGSAGAQAPCLEVAPSHEAVNAPSRGLKMAPPLPNTRRAAPPESSPDAWPASDILPILPVTAVPDRAPLERETSLSLPMVLRKLPPAVPEALPAPRARR